VARNAVLVDVEVADIDATDPKSLVELASESKREARRRSRKTGDPNESYDEVWCIFDVDTHENLREACDQAKGNDVHLAISNPCFELWLLLHFQSQTRNLDSRAALQELRHHLTNYDKTIDSLSELSGKFETAKSRAIALERKHELDETPFPSDNPSSKVWMFVDAVGSEY
jgi:hypothetical protein